jgi:hypothetical protein
MRQAGAVMIAFVEHENLGFMLQAAEGVERITRSQSRRNALRRRLGGSLKRRPRL